MRKIYSLVLMATMLLVGTNAWADVHATLVDGVDEAKVTKDGGSTWMYATHLKEAFDYVEMNETAEIVLLNNADLSEPITMPKQIVAADMVGATAKKGQNITLDLGNSNLSISTTVAGVTMFRLVKGTLNITGNGSILKTAAESGSGKYWWGSTAIAVGGTEYKDSADWSVLTIDKNVTISVTGNSGARAIGIANHNGIGTSTYNSDMLYCKETITDLRNKYGYDTRVTKKVWNTALTDNFEHQVESAIAQDHTDHADYSERLLPMDCGQITSDKKTILQGAAFGVKVTVAGTISAPEYALHMHGNINQVPGCAGAQTARDMNLPAPYYETQFPYIYIAPTAHIEASASPGNVGLYAAGWAVWDISGEVKGATGVYAKAGDIVLKDAVITSTCATPGQNGNEGDNLSSGVNDAGGSAIVIESSDTYAGATGVTVQGDTKITGNGGYAIFDQTTKTDGTEPTTTHITVEGGTIESGGQGGIMVTDGTVDVTTIVGGNVTPTVEVTNTTTGETIAVPVNNFIPEGTHTTTVTDGTKTIVVVSQGAAPTGQENFCNAAPTASIKWTGTSKTITTDSLSGSGNKLVLKELEINNMSGTPAVPVAQNLTIASGVTLEVGKVILGPAAVVTVEAGAKLLVTGTQGMVAPVTSNLVLKATATSQATFVIAPKVTSNKQPKGSVEYYTDAYGMPKVGTSTNYKWDRLTTPLSIYEKVSSNYSTLNPKPALLPGETGIWTFIEYYDEVNAQWVGLSAYSQMNAFTNYALTNNTAAGGITYTFKGNLQGNVADHIELDHAGWNYMGNAFLAPIHVKTMLEAIATSGAGIDHSLYLWDMDAQSYKPAGLSMYQYFSNGPIKEIPAMQTFIIKLTSGYSALLDLDYENSVYKYVTNPASYSAPQRTIDTDVNVFRMNIMSANGEEDNVYMVESGEFTADYDNGADIVKYMNNGINFYAEGEEKYAMVASDNIQGTIFSLQTTEAINYTLTFAEVRGEEYALRDNMTNTVTNIVEGATYNFYAQPNETIEGRFEIVSRQEMPTAVETVEETVNAPKAIYTIMGQYVGQDWNALPAGVYVVDGVKVVK